MKLSILIPITPERYETVQPLLDLVIGKGNNALVEVVTDTHWAGRFTSVIHPEVEVCMISDEKEMTLGEKRERLYKMASGEYSLSVDSDDLIAPDAIEKILAAIDNKPDCITFCEKCIINGNEFKSNFSHRYEYWEGAGCSLLDDGFHYHRTVFYKCVIKTEIARSVPFKYIRYGEDFEWAKDLKGHIHSEIHLDEELYYYIHNSTPQEHETRYGFDKQ